MIDVNKIRRILEIIRKRLLTRISENGNNHEYLLDNTVGHATIKLRKIKKDGAPIGNQNAAGPHNMNGTPSARGANKRCTGFEHKKTAEYKLRKHQAGYPDMTVEQYTEKACDLLEKPCGDQIDGYLQEDGSIVRYDRATGDFAIGFPGGHLKSMFNIGYNSHGNFSQERADRNFDKFKERDDVQKESQNEPEKSKPESEQNKTESEGSKSESEQRKPESEQSKPEPEQAKPEPEQSKSESEVGQNGSEQGENEQKESKA